MTAAGGTVGAGEAAGDEVDAVGVASCPEKDDDTDAAAGAEPSRCAYSRGSNAEALCHRMRGSVVHRRA